MSRHRNVRSMNYQDEYDGYDDVYGHSVDDDYCVSPSTASQFTYDRGRTHQFGSYMEGEEIPEEDSELVEEQDSLQESGGSNYSQPQLSDIDQAKLNSCLEELRSIVGDTCPERLLVSACIATDFDIERAANSVLNQQDGPKPQREKKERDRKYRGSRISASNHTSNTDKPPTPKVVVPEPVVAQATAVSIATPAQGIARLTFTSGNKTVSGFTPEKEEQNPFKSKSKNEDEIDKAKKALLLDVDQVKTPVRTASALDLLKKGAEGDASPTMRRNVSAADLTKSEAKLSRNKLDKAGVLREYERRKAESKDCINLVVIGHVDAGKSTLMGHVLYQLGFVNKRTMHKYEQESKRLGKASFAYAWVLDETEEERSRGVTMDVAQSHFETDTKLVRLLDAPGHKDFIPNMITGAAQADVAVLVVDATKGEFETGFDAGGQTREHAMLIRSLGVSQLAVAVNKMDTVDWAKTRFDDIVRKLKQFLKQAGFKENDVIYIPCSGLMGDNLVNPSTNADVSAWYTGPTLVQQIDKFVPPDRPIDKPFRICVADVFKGMGSGFSVSGMIQSGCVQSGDRLYCMPQANPANVKSVLIDDFPVSVGFAGDNAVLTVTGIDMTDVSIGSIMCDPSSPIKSTSRLKARVVIFNIDLPITKGFPVVFHYQSMSEPAHVRKLISQLNKSTGEIVRTRPRCLTKNTSAMIELELERPVCIELYKDFKDLGRFMLRYSGTTIAAGLVTEIVNTKGHKVD